MAMTNSVPRLTTVCASLLAIAVFDGGPAAAQRVVPPGPASSFIVESGRAGAFEIGMTVDEAQAIAGVANTKLIATYGEGMFQPQLEILLPGYTAGPAITAPISDFPCGAPALRGLLVRDPRFTTSRGIHVGSALADIRKYAPSAKISNFDADGFPGVFDAEPDVSFAFERATESRDSARVTALWIHDGPSVTSRRCPGDRDWAAVYQAVLDSVVMPSYPKSSADAPPLIVMAETAHMCDASPLKPLAGVGCLERARIAAPFLTGELARAFFGRNSGRYQVPMLDGASALVAAAALPRVLRPADSPSQPPWFRVVFSSPGFDSGRAVVYVSVTCGNLCGEGSLVLLERRNDKWQVADVRLLWVS